MDEDEEGLVLAAADYNKRRLEQELDHWVAQQDITNQFLEEDGHRLEEHCHQLLEVLCNTRRV